MRYISKFVRRARWNETGADRPDLVLIRFGALWAHVGIFNTF